jgi:hypothetical protein
MTKRSAITMAAGLAMALLVGVTAVSLMLGGTSVATASGQHRKPLVKQQVQTVTVHRKAPQTSGSGGVRIVHLSGSSGSNASSSYQTAGYGDDGFESEGTEGGSPDDGASTGSTGSSQGFFGDD